MCWCDPNKRTPWCGAPGCQQPTSAISAPTPAPYTTLENYIKAEYAHKKIDFIFRASVDDNGVVRIYIHPAGKDGITTGNLLVKGNLVLEE